MDKEIKRVTIMVIVALVVVVGLLVLAKHQFSSVERPETSSCLII